MKAFLAACLKAIVLAAISLIVLNYVQEPTAICLLTVDL